MRRECLISPAVHLFQAGLLQPLFGGCIQRAEAADQQLGQYPALGALGSQLDAFLATAFFTQLDTFFPATFPALQDALMDPLPNAYLPALLQPALLQCAHLTVLSRR